MRTTNRMGPAPIPNNTITMTKAFSLPKAERINSKKQIDRLFQGGGSKAMTASPLRAVFRTDDRSEDDTHEPTVQMMVSVPKRYFKRAVKRNHIKRQVREAYRLNKHILAEALGENDRKKVAVCFIWTDDRLRTSQEVHEKVKNLLSRLSERIRAAEKPKDGSGNGSTVYNGHHIPNAL